METRTLNDGTTVKHKPSNHTYEAIDAKGIITVPTSVTTIMKPVFSDFGMAAAAGRKNLRETLIDSMDYEQTYKWNKTSFTKYLKEASRNAVGVWTASSARGSEIHDFLECYAKGLKPKFSTDDHIKMLQSNMLDWYKERVEETLSVEKLIYSKEPLYAGKYDLEAVVKDYGRCLVDYKSGSASALVFSEKWAIQLAGYMHAVLQEEHTNEFGRLIVHVNRDNGVVTERYYSPKTYRRDLCVWLNICNIHQFIKDYKKEWSNND